MLVKWEKKDRSGKDVAGVLTVTRYGKTGKSGTIVLIPGYNEIPVSVWAEIKGQLKEKINRGYIIPMMKKDLSDVQKTEDENFNLSSLSVSDLVTLFKKAGVLDQVKEGYEKENGKGKPSKEFLLGYVRSDVTLLKKIKAVFDEGTEEVDIKDMSSEKIIPIIRETYDLDLLKKWQKEDPRDEVRIEIKNQIEDIESPKVKRVI